MNRLLTTVAVAVSLVASLAACRTPQQRAGDLIPGFEARLQELGSIRPADLLPAANPLVGHYWQSGTRIPVTIVPNVLAVRGPRSLVRQGSEFIPGVLGDAGDAHPALRRLTNDGLYFAATTPEGSPEIDALLDAPPAGALVGRALLYPRPDADPLTWGAAVLTRQVLGNVRPEVVQGLTDDEARAKVGAIVAPLGLDVTDARILGGHTFLFRVRDRDPYEWLRAAERLHDDRVSAGIAHPNLILGMVLHATAGDLYQSEQWNLRNTGQGGGTPGADIRVEWAWVLTKGSPSVVIGIIDSAPVDLAHPDLSDRVAPGSFDYMQASTPYPDAHATWVAGVAVASWNSFGVRGVAPNCLFVSIAVGSNPPEDWIVGAIDRCIEANCRVINMSWGYGEGTVGMTDSVRQAVTRAVEENRCVVVASMSNVISDADAVTPSFAQHPDVIAVGRSTNTDLWGRCGYGACVSIVAPAGYAPGSYVERTECDLTPPGGPFGTRNIASTDPTWAYSGNAEKGRPCRCQEEDADSPLLDLDDLSYTHCFRGTSAAAAQVAGAAALILSLRPSLRPAQVRRIIEGTARKIPAPLGVPVSASTTKDFPYMPVPGTNRTRSDAVGHGCLNVGAAVWTSLWWGWWTWMWTPHIVWHPPH